jgi:hypothetical protein
MNLVQRVQDILLKPKETWATIEAESTDAASLYKQYLIILAAIPAVAQFIGLSILGVGAFGFSYRVPLLSGLTTAIVSYALSLAVIFGLSLIADALAPSFGGTKNPNNALKLVAYAYTASFVAGVFFILPSLTILALIGSLYGIYLLYLGAPVLMKTPQDKAPGYVAVVVICGIVAMVVIGAVTTAITGGAGVAALAHRSGGEFSFNSPDGKVTIDTTKLQEAAARAEAAAKQVQAANDPSAAGNAAAAALGGTGQPFNPQDLKALLPEAASGLKRVSIESEGTGAAGFNVSTAQAHFQDESRHIELKITDFGGGGGLLSFAAWASVTLDKETDTSVDKIYKQGDRSIHEQYQKDGSRAEYTVILANGAIVEATGNGVPFNTVKAAVDGIDLAKLEAMKHAPKG